MTVKVCALVAVRGGPGGQRGCMSLCAGGWLQAVFASAWDAVLVIAGSRHGLYGPCELCRCRAASFLVDTQSCISISLSVNSQSSVSLSGCPGFHILSGCIALQLSPRTHGAAALRFGPRSVPSSSALYRGGSGAALPSRGPRSSSPLGAGRWWPGRGEEKEEAAAGGGPGEVPGLAAERCERGRRRRSRPGARGAGAPGAGAMRGAAAALLLAVAAALSGAAAAAVRSCAVQSVGCKCAAERHKASGPAVPRRRVLCSGAALPAPPEPRLLPDGTATL